MAPPVFHPNVLRSAALLLILLLQTTIFLVGLDKPLVDGRSHRVYDTVNFVRRAAHSIDTTVPDGLKVFGLASYRYDKTGTPISVHHYGNHGVLGPTLLVLHCRVFGATVNSVRTFCFLLSLACTVLLFLLLRTAVRHPGLLLGLLLLYVLLPLKLFYLDRWKFESVAELAILATFLCFQDLTDRRRRYLFLALLALMFHSDFAAWLAALGLLVYIFVQRGDDTLRALRLPAVIAASVGLASAVAVQTSLGYGVARASEKFQSRMAEGLQDIPIPSQIMRQLEFLDMNLGAATAALMLALFLGLLMTRKLVANRLLFFGATLFLMQTAWIVVFRNHVYIHHYAQWFYGTALILLLGGTSGLVARSERLDALPLRRLGAIAFAVLIAMNLAGVWTSKMGNRGFGSAEDVEALLETNRRIIVFDDGASGPITWWESPAIRLYTDPVWRGSTQVGVMRFGDVTDPDPQRDVVVIGLSGQEIVSAHKAWTSKFGSVRFREVRRTSTLLFLSPE